MADEVEIDRPVVKWGNSYGVRLTQADIERLGIGPGERVRGRLRSDAVKNNLDQVAFPKLGLPVDADELDRLVASDVLHDAEESAA